MEVKPEEEKSERLSIIQRARKANSKCNPTRDKDGKRRVKQTKGRDKREEEARGHQAAMGGRKEDSK